MKSKMVSLLVAMVVLVLVPVGQAVTTTYMDATTHNGSFSDGPVGYTYGFWASEPLSIPTGWVETAVNLYTTGGLYVQCGSTAEAVNNTGEVVHAYQQFTVSADMGGGDGIDATVRVYATQNADGTGAKHLLASVHRLGQVGDSYTLFNVVGTPGDTAPPSVEGYYVQVRIGGPYVDHYIAGYYDNIVVTSEDGTITSMTYMDAVTHNGSFTNGPEGYTYGFWASEPLSIPTGWVETAVSMYTTGTRWIQCGSTAEAVCNTGEIVLVGHAFSVSADLGGGDGVDATVRVYATQNADGTGESRFLASVHRLGQVGDGYTLFHTVGAPGQTAAASLAGYYVQVRIGGPYVDHYIAGYYDNIVVTSEEAPLTWALYMDGTFNNGSFTADTYGFWYNTPGAIPAGWTEITQYMYTTGTMWVQCGSVAEAVNNTGEVVPADHAFTITASMGGGEGILAKVRVYATQNADGSGDKVLLAEAQRYGQSTDGYTLFPVSATGSRVQPSVVGWYVQVQIGGPPEGTQYIAGYYDNIGVTSEVSTGPITITYMDATTHNGSMTATAAGYWNVPASKPSGGWGSTDDPNVYTAASQFTLFGSEVEYVFNNTGSTVPIDHQFTIQATLGGKTDVTAHAFVYATQNADGSGDKVLLAQANRPGNDADGYSMFPVSATGSPTGASVEGYFVRVELNTTDIGDPNLMGYYDNFVVTSTEVTGSKTYMTETLHNGGMTATSGGYWTDPAHVPNGWSADDPNFAYTAGTMVAWFDSPAGAVTNNTQESVLSGQAFTVQADLGGMTGATAHVYVYATQNWDGTGATVLLAEVSRAGNDADGTDLFTVSATGSLIGAEYSGYYVQVVLVTTGAADKLGFYDNIIVTSSEPSVATCRDQFDAATQAYYDRYVTEPVAWCWQFQCKGDADNGTESVFIEGDYRIYDADLTLLVNNWKGTPEGGANPAADFDHMEEAVFIEGSYAIYDGDLTILVNNWKKTDGELSNCPSYLP